jgi:signal transduction histidine kinase
VDGTLEAQRMILGLLCLLFGYFYLTSLTASQCTWDGYAIRDPDALFFIVSSFLQGRRVVVATFLPQAVDLFTLPIIYQFFRNRNCRLFISVLATLIFAQTIDSFLYQLVSTSMLDNWWPELRATYLARSLAMVWISTLASIYLHLCDVPAPQGRRVLDIVVAFFGSYGRAQQLQKHILEWEDRYRVIVENSSELIFILDAQGRIVNTNHAATHLLHESANPGARLPDIISSVNGEACDWDRLWQSLLPQAADKPSSVLAQEWIVQSPEGGRLYLEAHVSSATLYEHAIAIVIARDVTERHRLEEERQQLQEQLVHTQRLEAVGQLAGGVAHDFNNMLHTVQGALDGLSRYCSGAQAQAMISNISTATQRASVLTSQLLGFARRGKYRSERLDLISLMKDTQRLFEPVAGKKTEVKMVFAPGAMYIMGDGTQLQQVFLNMLLNARDALEGQDRPGKIVFRAEPVAEHCLGWTSRPQDLQEARADDYLCVRIKDNGSGIPDKIRANIFEPFFTTKEVGKGTGMGLAMAYGCIVNHHGWIHLESTPGKGTEFYLMLPRSE